MKETLTGRCSRQNSMETRSSQLVWRPTTQEAQASRWFNNLPKIILLLSIASSLQQSFFYRDNVSTIMLLLRSLVVFAFTVEKGSFSTFLHDQQEEAFDCTINRCPQAWNFLLAWMFSPSPTTCSIHNVQDWNFMGSDLWLQISFRFSLESAEYSKHCRRWIHCNDTNRKQEAVWGERDSKCFLEQRSKIFILAILYFPVWMWNWAWLPSVGQSVQRSLGNGCFPRLLWSKCLLLENLLCIRLILN